MKSPFGAALVLSLCCAPAAASVHFISVVEVFPGTVLVPSAQYVVVQMYFGGQTFTNGARVDIYNRQGVLVGGGEFQGNVSNGAEQAKILIGTTSAETLFGGVQADLEISPGIIASGGRVCWFGEGFENIDCAAWGDDPGSATSSSTSSVGTPFRKGLGGLPLGQAMKRRLDVSGSASELDAADDTGNSKNDFILGAPAPRNNGNINGTVPPATCGNNAVEGLEQCDVGDVISGDGCDNLCRSETDLIFFDGHEGF